MKKKNATIRLGSKFGAEPKLGILSFLHISFSNGGERKAEGGSAIPKKTKLLFLLLPSFLQFQGKLDIGKE
jgi:hypothetical protein